MFSFDPAADSWQSKFSKKCYLIFQTFNSEPLPLQFPPSKSQPKTQNLQMSIQRKTQCFFSCISILVVQKVQKKSLGFYFFSSFKLIFQQNYRLYLCDQDRHRKNSSCSGFSDGRFVHLCSSHSCLDSPNCPRSATLFNFAQFSNSYSSATTNLFNSFSWHSNSSSFVTHRNIGFISSIRVSMENF